MRVLLINSPIPVSYYNREYYLPSSLLYLASVLEKNGEEVKILDLKCAKYEIPDNPYKHYGNIIIDTISDFGPDLIGFGCLFSGNFPDILRFSVSIKKKYPIIPIVIGGIHPTIYPKEIMANCPSIDWIVLGEGEETIVKLINTVKTGRYDFDQIDGFAFRNNGTIVVNPKTTYIKELDTIPFPAYHLVSFKDYYEDTSKWHNPKELSFKTSIPIITSRSCPNRCSFCSMFMVMGPKWRDRSPQNVVDEIEYVYSKYNQNHFSFMDDNLTLKKSHVLEICNQILKRKLNIQFETPSGISIKSLDEEVLDALVSAGLVRVSLAIESGSDFIRNKIMKKHLSKQKIYEIVHLAKRYKHLYIKAFFIIGLPEETHETLSETYHMIQEINVDRVYLQNIVPFPGTEVFKQALRDNLLVDINPETLYKSDALYLTNYSRYFIKPYQLDLKDLQKFRDKCDSLIEEQNADKKMLIKRLHN